VSCCLENFKMIRSVARFPCDSWAKLHVHFVQVLFDYIPYSRIQHTSPAEIVTTVDVTVTYVTRDRRIQLSLTCTASQTGHVPSTTHRRQIVPVGYSYSTSGARGLTTASDTVVLVRNHSRMWQLKIVQIKERKLLQLCVFGSFVLRLLLDF